MDDRSNEPPCTCDARTYNGLGLTTHAPECARVAARRAPCYGNVADLGTYAGSLVAAPGQLPSEADDEWNAPANLVETIDRARLVINILERCAHELALLEMIPSPDADDVNALSAAKGFVSRARNALRGRFQ